MSDNFDKDRAFLSVRRLYLNLITLERKYMAKLRHAKLLSKFLHHELFSIKPLPLCRGLAVGLFWAFIPMPFQMVPATIFCLLSYANLPIAIIAVWLSNPLTYVPIFYVEYLIGHMLFAPSEAVSMSFDQFSQTVDIAEIGQTISDIFVLILKGGLVLSSCLAVVGYILGYPLSKYLNRYADRRRKLRARRTQ